MELIVFDLDGTLLDSRGLGGPSVWHLSDEQAHAVLVGGPRERVPLADWAIGAKLALDLDGWCVPLAIDAGGRRPTGAAG